MVQKNQHGAGTIAPVPRGKKLFLGRVMFCLAAAVARNALTITGIHFVGGSLLASGAPPECDQLNFHPFHTLLEFSVWMSGAALECSEIAATTQDSEEATRLKDERKYPARRSIGEADPAMKLCWIMGLADGG